MSYTSGCSGTRANYFANPDVSYLDKPTGTETENCARAIQENKVGVGSGLELSCALPGEAPRAQGAGLRTTIRAIGFIPISYACAPTKESSTAFRGRRRVASTCLFFVVVLASCWCWQKGCFLLCIWMLPPRKNHTFFATPRISYSRCGLSTAITW